MRRGLPPLVAVLLLQAVAVGRGLRIGGERTRDDEASSEADSVPGGLVVAIAALSQGELSHALQAQGIEDAGDRDANVAALARAMLA